MSSRAHSRKKVSAGWALLVGLLAAALCVAGFTASATLAAGPAGATPVYYRLVQYPQAGFGGYYKQITAAKHAIDIEIYELVDTTVERDLVAAERRGVHVRVLLDKDYSGSANDAAYSYLHAHHVPVEWGPAGYIYHVKASVFDGRTADISTANLTSKYYRDTRDAEIVDTNPAQVTAISRTLDRDWNAGSRGEPKTQTAQGPGLVWSPNTGSGTAETAFVQQIEAAKHSLDLESEELSDPYVYDALAAAAHRGVTCEIVMTNSSEWKTAFAKVTKAGCKVHVFADTASALYIHEKLILDDHGHADQSLLIGSQNAADYSLTRNRELSVKISAPHGGTAVMTSVAKTFAQDYADAKPWKAPSSGSGSSACHPTSSSGHCYSAGEYCSDADHGETGVAANGEAIICEVDNGWRWEPTS